MQNNGIGNQPECGAIFMSNSATKKECLERKLFGLSSKHSHFVKQIKVGMILFLFEYEKRQLHGVFEACSDGRMNIIPDAFSTSGIYFPAQVKVRCIWMCKPLCEREFGSAIEDNYFCAKKFKFGLSEHQVSSLLHLFSSKKYGVPRQLTKIPRNPNLIVQATDKGRQVEDTRSEVHDRIDDEYVPGFINMDIEPISATITGYPISDKVDTGHFKYHRVDIPSNDGFLRSNECYRGFSHGSAGGTEYFLQDKVELGRSDYSPNTELREAVSTRYSNYCSGDVERFPSNGVFLRNDGYEPLVLSNNHSSFLPTKFVRRLVQPTKPLEIRSFVPDQSTKQPSLMNHHIQSLPQSDIVSYKAPCRDAIVMSTRPNNSVAPSLNYPLPQADEYNSHSAGQGYQPYCGYPNKQQFSSYLEQIRMANFPDKISTLADNTSFSGSAPNENTYFGSIKEQASYGKNLDVDPEKNQRFMGLSSSEYSIRSRINTSDNVYPFLDTSNSYRVETEDRLQHEAAHKKKRESSESYEDSFRSQAFLSPADPRSVQLHERASSLEYNPDHYQIPDTVFNGGSSKNYRASVFSRLKLAQDAYVPDKNAHVDYEDGDATTMVDDVMEMLRASRQQWVKSKKPKPGKREQDDAQKFARGKQTVASEEEVPLESQMPVKEKLVGFSFGGAVLTPRFPEVTPLFNFKRRSEAKKLREDGKAAFCDASSRNDEGVSEGPRKKRKLIRPNFGNSDKDSKNCTSTLQAQLVNNAGRCEASIESSKETSVVWQREEGDVQKESPVNNVELQNNTISSDCEGKKPNAISDSLTLEPFLGAEIRNEVGGNESQVNRKADLLPTARGAPDGTCANSLHQDIIDRINNSVDQFCRFQVENARQEQ